MGANKYQSWGRYSRKEQKACVLGRQDDSLPLDGCKKVLPYGNGRSYGDVCLNDDGVLLDTRGLNRVIRFDKRSGILRCEAGILLSEIIDLVLPYGWFLPVTPGTKFITLGGAIANDVHGKNHHHAGSFGCYLRCLELLRSDGQRLLCSGEENADLFRATIGGLGLTGLIVWGEIDLKPVGTSYINMETIKCLRLREVTRTSLESSEHFEYTVAWLDCFARGGSLGRGIVSRGNHATQSKRHRGARSRISISVPAKLPPLVNHLSVRTFNNLYYHRQSGGMELCHYDRFFYPLDTIHNWNRIYGARGFFQFQCVVPNGDGEAVVHDLIERIGATKEGSFLVVFKLLGDKASPGFLSFPRPGMTLAIDFPNRGQVTRMLLAELDAVVRGAGGAVYPAKDACMPPASFNEYFPRWREFRDFIDPAFSSNFWRRVTQGLL